ncbi:MAG: hypothetical protein HY900_37695, partial [Deltaproteobacteria bacterium]|nr:hypothetical protein [Deltaproteobacteria bacterium]
MKVSRPLTVLAIAGLWAAALPLALGTALLPAELSAAPPAAQSHPPLGRWIDGCSAGFRLASMPNAWVVDPGQPVKVFTRLAVDFDALPENEYVAEVAPDGEKTHQLVGYATAFLRAEIRAAGSVKPVAVLTGTRLDATSGTPAELTWSGLDQQGRPVPPGEYEIEVRGRMLPSWAEDLMRNKGEYADLEGWTNAAEACTRVLRIEVVEGSKRLPATGPLAATCASAPASYYATVDASTPATLRATLHAVIDDHVRFPYTSSTTDTWDILNDADENP